MASLVRMHQLAGHLYDIASPSLASRHDCHWRPIACHSPIRRPGCNASDTSLLGLHPRRDETLERCAVSNSIHRPIRRNPPLVLLNSLSCKGYRPIDGLLLKAGRRTTCGICLLQKTPRDVQPFSNPKCSLLLLLIRHHRGPKSYHPLRLPQQSHPALLLRQQCKTSIRYPLNKRLSDH